MSVQVAEANTQVFDVVKQVISAIFVIAGVAAFYYFANDIALLYRVLALVAIVCVAAGLVLSTEVGKGFWSFMLESKQEVRKIVWPTRDETFRTTLMVFVMVSLVGVILWLLDMFLFWGIRLLTGQV